MRLISGSRATLAETIPEARLNEVLIFEVARTYGLTTGDALTKGVSGSVTVEGRVGTRHRACRVEVTFDRDVAGQASLPKPEGAK